jgi:hypothetical protein
MTDDRKMFDIGVLSNLASLQEKVRRKRVPSKEPNDDWEMRVFSSCHSFYGRVSIKTFVPTVSIAFITPSNLKHVLVDSSRQWHIVDASMK